MDDVVLSFSSFLFPSEQLFSPWCQPATIVTLQLYCSGSPMTPSSPQLEVVWGKGTRRSQGLTFKPVSVSVSWERRKGRSSRSCFPSN